MNRSIKQSPRRKPVPRLDLSKSNNNPEIEGSLSTGSSLANLLESGDYDDSPPRPLPSSSQIRTNSSPVTSTSGSVGNKSIYSAAYRVNNPTNYASLSSRPTSTTSTSNSHSYSLSTNYPSNIPASPPRISSIPSKTLISPALNLDNLMNDLRNKMNMTSEDLLSKTKTIKDECSNESELIATISSLRNLQKEMSGLVDNFIEKLIEEEKK